MMFHSNRDLIPSLVWDVRIFNLYLVNPFCFVSLRQNTVGKTMIARYPFILIYAFAMVLVKLM